MFSRDRESWGTQPRVPANLPPVAFERRGSRYLSPASTTSGVGCTAERDLKMGLDWPGISSVGGTLEGQDRQDAKAMLDEFGEALRTLLRLSGFALHASPIFRPWNAFILRDSEKLIAVFTPLTGGVALLQWLDQPGALVPAADLVKEIADEFGHQVAAVVILPRPDVVGDQRGAGIAAAAGQHLSEVERAHRLGRLGDLTGLTHLEPALRLFLD